MARGRYPIPNPFDIGVHRPVYSWGGPGTVRMNRLKFMGARRMAEEAVFSWGYLLDVYTVLDYRECGSKGGAG